MAFASKTELVGLQKKLGTDEAIAKKFKVTRQAVHQLRTKHGIPSLLVKNPERNDKIVSMYKAGKTGTEIAEKIGLSMGQVYRVIAQGTGKKSDKRKKTAKKKK